MKSALRCMALLAAMALVGCGSSSTSTAVDVPSIGGSTSTTDNAPGTGIFGRVTDPSGEPLAGARLELVSATGQLLAPAVTTDTDGQYTMPAPSGGVPEGAYLRITPDGGRPVQAPMGDHGGPHLNVQFQHDGSMALHNGSPRA